MEQSTVIAKESSPFVLSFDMEDSGKEKKARQHEIPVAVESHKRVYAVIVVLAVLTAFLLIAVISLCIAFSVEIANLKSEIESGRQQNLTGRQTQQKRQLASNSSLQDISVIVKVQQDVNSSLEMLLRDIAAIESRLRSNSFQQLLQNISSIEGRVQGLNSSLEMLSQQLLQDRQEITAIDSRIQELNSSLSERLLQNRQEISAFINGATQELNSSLSEQLLQSRQELDSRIQEVNYLLEMQQLQVRQNISAVDSRAGDVNSSIVMFSLQSDIDGRIDSLSQQVDDVQMQADQTVSRLEMLGSLETFPAPSCSIILSTLPSGYYLLRASNGSAVSVFCNMTLMFGNVTGWARVAQLSFDDINEPCPSGFSERMDSGIRTCHSDSTGCISIDYSTFGISYSSVYGKVMAYQIGTPEAYSRLLVITSLTIDSQYLDGLSLTHGQNPRQHIWSFAAGVTDGRTDRFGCPCNTGSTVSDVVTNTFIETDYFCDTAATSLINGMFYPDDPLWDGAGCGAQSMDCCSLNTPPWFHRQLPQPTSDDMELRVCRDEDGTTEGTPIESFEFYIQ